MRLVQVHVPDGGRDGGFEALDEEGLDYAVFDEVGRGDSEATVQFPVPPSGVEPLLGRVTDAGVLADVRAPVDPAVSVLHTR